MNRGCTPVEFGSPRIFGVCTHTYKFWTDLMTEIDRPSVTSQKEYDPYTEWLGLAQYLEIYLEEVQTPHTRFGYSPDGIKRIPYTNKQWISYIGTETPPHVGMVWLKPGLHYRAKDRLDHIMPIRYYRGLEWRIVWCMVKNTLLCKKLASADVKLEAIKDTIRFYLKDYTDCPIVLIDRVSDAIGFVAMIELDSRADCTVEEIGNMDSKYSTTRGAIDYACRNDLWTMLTNHGIGALRTRKQQEALIDRILTLPKFSHLHKGIKASILFRLRRNNLLKPDVDKISDRVADIQLKQLSNTPLTPADRQYIHRHKDLFTF